MMRLGTPWMSSFYFLSLCLPLCLSPSLCLTLSHKPFIFSILPALIILLVRFSVDLLLFLPPLSLSSSIPFSSFSSLSLLPRHRAVNLFLQGYAKFWISADDHSFEEKLVEDLAVSENLSAFFLQPLQMASSGIFVWDFEPTKNSKNCCFLVEPSLLARSFQLEHFTYYKRVLKSNCRLQICTSWRVYCCSAQERSSTCDYKLPV